MKKKSLLTKLVSCALVLVVIFAFVLQTPNRVYAAELAPGAVDTETAVVPISGLNNTYDITMRVYGNSMNGSTMDIVLVLDTSDSMEAAGLQKLKAAAKSFVNIIFPDGVTASGARIGVVSFGSSAKNVTTGLLSIGDKSAILTAIDTLTLSGNTMMQGGLKLARDMFAATAAGTQKVMLLFTDGDPNVSHFIKDGVPSEYAKSVDGGYRTNTADIPMSWYDYAKTSGGYYASGSSSFLNSDNASCTYNASNSAIAESRYIKALGNTNIYTTFYSTTSTTMPAKSYALLSEIASSASQCYLLQNDITTKFNAIANELSSRLALTSGVTNITIPTGFHIINTPTALGSTQVTTLPKQIQWSISNSMLATSGVTGLKYTGNTVSYAELTFRVGPDSEIGSVVPGTDGKYPLLPDTSVTYTDQNGTTAEKSFDNGAVPIVTSPSPTAVSILLDNAPDNEIISAAEKGSATTTDVKVSLPDGLAIGDKVFLTYGTTTLTQVLTAQQLADKAVTFKDIPLPPEGDTLTTSAKIQMAGTAASSAVSDKALIDTTVTPFPGSLADQTVPVNSPISDITGLTVAKDEEIQVTGLPSGVTYDKATGVISGSPDTVGDYPVKVVITDTTGNKAEKTITIHVTEITPKAVTIDLDTNNNGVINKAEKGSATTTDVTVTLPDSGLRAGESIVISYTEGGVAKTQETVLDAAAIAAKKVTFTGVKLPNNGETLTVDAVISRGATQSPSVSDSAIISTAGAQITPIPDQTKNFGAPIDEITVVSDAGTGAVTEVTGLPGNVTYDPATGKINGTPDKPGSYQVTVTVTDGHGNVSTELFNINVIPAAPNGITIDLDTNNDGVINAAEKGSATTTEITVSLPDSGINVGDTLTLRYSDGAAGQTTTVAITAEHLAAKSVTFTNIPLMPEGQLLTAEADITNTVGTSSAVTDSATVRAKLPTISPIADQSKVIGQPIDPVTVVTDAGAGAVISADGLPAGVTITPDGLISGTPTNPGIFEVTVKVTDVHGNLATEKFLISVSPDSPKAVEIVLDANNDGFISAAEKASATTTDVLVTLPDANVKVGDKVSLDTDNDGTADMFITLTNEMLTAKTVRFTDIPLPAEGKTLVVNAAVIAVTAGQADIASTPVSDSALLDTTLPAITPIADQNIYLGDLISSVEVIVDDPTAAIAVTGLPDGTSYNAADRVISGKPTAIGSYTVTVTATDIAGNKATETFVINVTEKPDNLKYDPAPVGEVIRKGESYDITNNIANIGDLPADTIITDVTAPGAIDNNTPGHYTGKVKVTYPDSTFDLVDIPVTVLDIDSNIYDPVGTPEKIFVGGSYDLTDNVAAKTDTAPFPAGTLFEDVTPAGTIDTSKKGSYTGKVKVTYPDNSTEIVDVEVIVSDKPVSKPDTGDNTPLVALAAVLAVSGAALIILIMKRKKS